MDINWSKSPEGATHYLPKQPDLGWTDCWYKKDGNTWYVLNAQDFEDSRVRWYIDNDDVDQFVPLLITKPEPTPWNGEGLPPVGTVCEAWHLGCEQGVVEIRYSGECMVLWSVSRKHEQCSASENYTFKVLRTPEQIAAEEREKAVIEMLYLDPLGGSRRGLAEALYDHGYRKQENNDAKD